MYYRIDPPIIIQLYNYALELELDPIETAGLEAWENESAKNQAIFKQFSNKDWVEEKIRQIFLIPSDEMWQQIISSLGPEWYWSEETMN